MIRWLLAGFGAAGRCHAAAIPRTPNAKLVGIVDRQRSRHPDDNVQTFTCIDRALEVTRPDAMIIATPHDTHREIALTALEADVAVLCEKPVGRNSDDARAIAGMANRRGVPAGVILNQRACLHPRWVHKLVHTGNHRWRLVNIWGNLGRLSGWHKDVDRSGGGLLRTVGIHYLDLLCWWFGQPVRISGVVDNAPTDDMFQLLLQFRCGAAATLSLSAVASASAGPVSIGLEAEDARIALTGHGIASVDGVEGYPPVEPMIPEFAFGPGHLTAIAEATLALNNGGELPVPVDEVLPLLALVDTLYEAAQRNESITLGHKDINEIWAGACE